MKMSEPVLEIIKLQDAIPNSTILMESIGDIFKEMGEEILAEACQHMDLKSGYKYFDIEIEKNCLRGNEFRFNPGKLITDQLEGCRKIAVFTVTLGDTFDNWCQRFFRNNDSVKGFIADTIGSFTTENAAEILHTKIETDCQVYGYNVTNRFSPGYCYWDVAEQSILFRILPKKFCGIRLNSSSLMKPIKSISGIIGIGKNASRSDYPCASCRKTDCTNRK
jgi:hypothetical protein